MPKGIWESIMSEEIEELKDLSFAKIGDEGVLLNSQAFDNLPFCEDKTLHFEPKAALAGAAE